MLRGESSLPLPPVGSIRNVVWRGGLWTGRPAAFATRASLLERGVREVPRQRRGEVDLLTR